MNVGTSSPTGTTNPLTREPPHPPCCLRDVNGGSPSSRRVPAARSRSPRPGSGTGGASVPPLSRCPPAERCVPPGPPYYRCGLRRERLHVSHRRSGSAAGRAPHRAGLDRTGPPLHRVRSLVPAEQPPHCLERKAVRAMVEPLLFWCSGEASGLPAPPASSC